MLSGNALYIGYGIFLILGAFMGLKSGSKVSLYMGLGSGLLTLIAACLLNSQPTLGRTLLIAISGLLTAVFVMRLMKTKKFMPAGMLGTVSLFILYSALTQLG